MQALVVDAGTSAADGHADTFVVEQHDNQVRILVNGKQISDSPISQLGKITIHGSSDDDVLIAEFKSGEPMAGLNLLFDGKGGNDSLVLNSNESVGGVTHNIGESGSNHVDIESTTGTATVAYSNVESVNDSLTAKSRTFNFDSGGQQVTLGDAGTSTDNRSQIDVTNSHDESQLSIIFKNPTDSLAIKTDTSSDKQDTIALNGVDHQYHADTRILGSPDDLLIAHGPTDFGGGNVELSAGTIKVESSLATTHANLDIHATNEIFIGSTGAVQNDAGNIRIEAPSIEHDGTIVAHGGLVHLDSGDNGATIVRGSVDVSQVTPSQPAGTVHILGSRVGLLDNAQIDATAMVSGGTILIGGDYQGKNPSIRNALRSYVGPNVALRADAGVSGDGGKVIVWSDEVTRFYGTISARGGSERGHGGFAEVSGKDSLEYHGLADLRAANGEMGSLLLDPGVLTISGGVSDGDDADASNAAFQGNASATAGSVLFADATPLTVFESEIEVQSVTANIILEATQSIKTIGNFVGDDVLLAAGSNLTLHTRNQAGDPAGVIDLTGSLDGANLLFRVQGTGTITIQGSTGGVTASDITLGRLQSDLGSINVSTSKGTVNLQATISSTTGSVGITGDVVNQNADITIVGSGAVSVTANTTDITMADLTTTTTVGGAITYTAKNDVKLSVLTSTSGSINVTADSAPANGTGAITDITALENANIVTTAGNVTLTAATGIGSLAVDKDIDTTIGAIGTLEATNTTTGDIVIQETNGLVIGGVNGVRTLGGNGKINIDVVTGALTINKPIAANGSGTVTLNADAVAQNANITAGAGTIDVTADTADITMSGLAVTTTTTGLITYHAAVNVSIGLLTSTSGAVNVTADTGSIEEVNNGANDIVTTGPVKLVTISATSHIGNASTLELGGVTDLTLDTDGSFDVSSNVALTDLKITVNPAGGGHTYKLADNGNLTFDVTNTGTNLTVTKVVAFPGSLNFTLISDTGNINLGLIDVVAGNVSIVATAGSITDGSVAETANIVTTGTATLTAATGIGATTAVDEDIDTTIGTLEATNNISGDIVIQETNTLIIGGTGVQSTRDIIIDVLAGTLTINQAINAGVVAGVGTGDVRFVARGNVTQAAAGTITADELGIRQQNAATGNVTLTAENDVKELAVLNLAATTAQGLVSFRDKNDLIVDTVTAQGTFTPDVDGITTTGTNDVLLNMGNTVTNTNGTLTINQAINAGVIAGVGTGDVRFVARGNVTQAAAGTITADELGIRQQNAATGNVTLTAENDVKELAVLNLAATTAQGLVSFRDKNDLIVDTVTAQGTFTPDVDGITTTGTNDVLLNMGNTVTNTNGTLTINQAINAGVVAGVGTGDVRFVARGNVTQAAAGTITADELGIRQQNAATGNVTLTAENDVKELAVLNLAATTAQGLVSFRDKNDLIVDTVTAQGTFTPDVDGITTTGTNDVLLNMGNTVTNTNGTLTINQAINAGVVAGVGTGDVRFVARGNVTQAAAGTITADELGIRQQNAATGNVTLTAENDVKELAVLNLAATTAQGLVSFRDKNDLIVDTVTAQGTFTPDVDGITTTGTNDVLLNMGNTVTNTNGTLTINQAINAGVVAGVGTGDVRFVARGNVTQAAAGTITADELGIRQQNAATGNVTLTAENDVKELAVLNLAATTAQGLVSFRDKNDLIVDTVTAQGTFTPDVDGITTTGTNDVLLNMGNTVTNTNGTLTINQAINAGVIAGVGTGDVRFVARGNVTQAAAGTITADELGIRQQNAATGNVTLTAENDVKELAVLNLAATTAQGLVSFRDKNDLIVDTVTAQGTFTPDVDGITTTGTNDVLLNMGNTVTNTNGTLTINQAINAGVVAGVGTGDVRFVARGNVTQAAAGTITADELGIRQQNAATGNVTLTAENDVKELAVLNLAATTAQGLVSFRDKNDLIVDTVTAQGTFTPDVDGITTTGTNDVLLNMGNTVTNTNGTLTINQAINAGVIAGVGTGDVRFVARGNVTQAAAGTITADELGIRQQNAATGNVTLTAENDVKELAVLNLAATTAQGLVSFRDKNDLIVDTVTAQGTFTPDVDGITTTGTNDVLLNMGNTVTNTNGTLTINQAINAGVVAGVGTGDVRFVARGNVTQAAAGTITADELGIRQQNAATGNVTLTAENDVKELAVLNLAATTAQGLVSFRDKNDLIVDTVTAQGTFTPDVDGITTTGTNDVLLNMGNTVTNTNGTLTINQAINAGVIAGVGTGDVRFVARGNVTQAAAGTITADELGIRQQNAATGNVTLTAENDVKELAVLNLAATTAQGLVSFRDKNDLIVDTVTAQGTFTPDVDGITTTGTNDVLLNMGNTVTNTNGTLTINQAINAGVIAGVGTGDVRFVARGNVTQAAAGTITADELGIRQQNAATGNVTLTAENDVKELAVLNLAATTAQGLVSFRDKNDLIVDTVTAQGTFTPDVDGITTTGTNDVLLNMGNTVTNTNGTLTINQAINAGVVAGVGTGDVRFVARGNVTQAAAGTITADELGIRQQNAATGNVTLTAENDVKELAVLNLAATTAQGLVSFRDKNDLIVDTVTAQGTFTPDVDGITTTGTNDVLLNMGNTVTNTNGTLTINQAINAGVIAGVGTGDVRFVARGNVTQAAAGTITADELGIRQQNAATGNVTLTAENDVKELAVLNLAATTAQGLVSFRDKNDLIVDTVTAQGTFTPDVDGITTTGTNDVLLNMGNTVTNTNGTLTINQAINAGVVAGVGTGDVRFVARGNVTQAAAGTITADELGIRQQNAATGNVTLTAENDVKELAVLNLAATTAQGLVSFRDKNDLIVDTVTAQGTFTPDVDGITTTGTNDVLLNMGNTVTNTNGTLTINQAINAGVVAGVGTGDVRFVARGNVTQAAAGTITADELGIRQQNAATGNVTLTAENDVKELAVLNLAATTAQGLVSFRDKNDLIVDTVTAQGTFTPDVDGITTTGTNDVLLNMGNTVTNTNGTLTINQAINAGVIAGVGTGDVRFVARGNVTQAAAGTITADELGIRQQNAATGNVTLTAENDVKELAVLNLAATTAQGLVSFRDKNDLIVDTVTAQGTFTPDVDGITTTGTNDVLLNMGNTVTNTNGTLTINQAINAGVVAGVGTGDVRFVARGNVTQAAAGTITADELGIRQQNAATGNVTLTAENDVKELAVLNLAATTAQGLVSFRDKNDLIVGSVATQGTFTGIDGIKTAGNNNDVTLTTLLGADHNITLAYITVAPGAKVTMDSGDRILDGISLTDSDRHQTDIRASKANLKAVNAIGTVSSFATVNLGNESNAPANANELQDAIELEVDEIELAETTAAGAAIHLISQGSGPVKIGTINVAGGNIGTAVIQSTQNLDAGLANFQLSDGDNFALLSAQTLSIPATGINVGVGVLPADAGDLRMIATTDIVTPGASLVFKSDDLFFQSGGTNGNANLTTNVTSLTAQLSKNDLAVTETVNNNPANDGIRLDSVKTTLGAITVTTAIDHRGNIDVGLVNAAIETRNVSLTAGGIINSITNDGVADVLGNVIALVAKNNAASTNGIVLDVTAHSRLDADTTTVVGNDANITIHSIGDLPVGQVTAGTKNVTLNSTQKINNSAVPDGLANVLGQTLDFTAETGGIGTLMPLEITAKTELIAKTLGTTNTTTPHILINSIGELPVGSVRAGTDGKGDVTLNSTKSIDNSNAFDGTANLFGSTVVLSSKTGGIGTVKALEVDVDKMLNGSTLGTTPNMNIRGIGDLPLGSLNAGVGLANVTLTSTGVIKNVADSADTNNVEAMDWSVPSSNGIGTSDKFIKSKVSTFAAKGGTGGIFLSDVDSVQIGAAGAQADQNINVNALNGGLTVAGQVESSTGNIDLFGKTLLDIQDNVVAPANNSKIVATVGGDPSKLTIGDNVSLQVGGSAPAQITGKILALNAAKTKFAALDNAAPDHTSSPIIGAIGIGAIQFNALDPGSPRLVAEIDWRGGTGPQPVNGTDPLSSVIPLTSLSSSPTDPRYVQSIFSGADQVTFAHTYTRDNPPDQAFIRDGFVQVRVKISGFGQGPGTDALDDRITLNALVGSTPVSILSGGQGTFFTIETIILVPFAGSLGGNAIPVAQPLPVAPTVRPTLDAPAEVVPLVETTTTQFEPAAGGVTTSGEEHYYELRIVYYDKEGNLVENEDVKIKLDDQEYQALNPFNPKLKRRESFDLSKLPVLFGRLPADHYRIYLIEDGRSA